MAIRNTPHDAANTAVRAFLTAEGEEILKKRFSKDGEEWEQILEFFKDDKNTKYKCAYCGTEVTKKTKLQMEHLMMLNRSQCGLHHPGNTVPICEKCNIRERKYNLWEERLERIYEEKELDVGKMEGFKDRIKKHMNKYHYKELDEETKKKVRMFKKQEDIKAQLAQEAKELKERITQTRWKEIREYFNDSCAFCGTKEEIQYKDKEYIFRFNWEECGYHHSGNVIPVCEDCKKSEKQNEQEFLSWIQQLKRECFRKGEEELFEERKQLIEEHIKKWEYPVFRDKKYEENLKSAVNELYQKVVDLVDQSIEKFNATK